MQKLIYVSLRKFKYSHHTDEELRTNREIEIEGQMKARTRPNKAGSRFEEKSDPIKKAGIARIRYTGLSEQF